MKKCSKCLSEKPSQEFSIDKSKSDGLRSNCKSCVSVSRTINKPKKKVPVHISQARSESYRGKNRIKVRAADARRKALDRARNPEKHKAYRDAYHLRNPDARRQQNNNRRARKLAVGGVLSPDIAKNLFVLQRGKCACCGAVLGDDYHLDHIVPLVLGGSNEDKNVQLLRAKCNLQKHTKHPVDFMQERGYLL